MEGKEKGVRNYGRKLIPAYFFSYALGNRVVKMEGQKLSINYPINQSSG